jgi:DNA-binding GntR family transcriptional regulator
VNLKVKNEPIRDGQNVQLIHQQLRSSILQGRLSPGQITSQLELTRDLGVGRTPLREALRLLQREGLVVSEPNRRVRIADISTSDAEEIYTMRIALEASAIRVSLPALNSQDFAEIEGLMAQMDHYMRTKDIERMNGPHRSFHLRFVRAAGPRWVEQIAQLFDHAERYRMSYFKARPERGQLRQAEHRAMLEAVLKREANLAVEQMALHYAHTALVVLRELDPGYVPDRLHTTIKSVAPRALKQLSF